jgi:hypothetical protein
VIAYLRGNLLGIIEENKVLLEVQGIGYEITVPVGLLHKLPAPGHEVELYTYLHVREDLLQLYGFPSLQDRARFQVLLNARGIGPKVALSIIDVFAGRDGCWDYNKIRGHHIPASIDPAQGKHHRGHNRYASEPSLLITIRKKSLLFFPFLTCHGNSQVIVSQRGYYPPPRCPL